MKISVFDSNHGKFTNDMIRWWQEQGHEVKMERGYNPEMVRWGDLIWFDLCDNNIKQAMYPDDPSLGYDLHQMDLTGKTIVCRPIDIDVWTGFQANVDWDLVDHTIFIAPHIQELANRTESLKNSRTKQHVIPCGVDTRKWRFGQRKPGKDIAWVCERWASKGVHYMLQILAKLPEGYKIHALGIDHDYAWEEAYYKDFIKRNGLEDKIVFYDEFIPDLDAWLRDKNYILSTSVKEAFGYSIAEAMAKGIKPVIHHFYGAEHIWPGLTWNTIDEAIYEIVREDGYDSSYYYDYLKEKGYTLDIMMNRITEAING